MTTLPLPSFEEPIPVEASFAERRYQSVSIEALRQGRRDGHLRQILCSPTGSGKTIVAGHLIKAALAMRSRCVFVADRIPLVKQTSNRFWQMGIPHGIVQSENTRDRHERVQVCSAQTLARRGFWPNLDFIIVDEAHTIHKKAIDFIMASGKPVIGLTATPFTKGLGKVYTNVVNTCTTDYLLSSIDPETNRPYLAPLKVYAAQEIDMAGAKTDKAGEWLDREVESRGRVIIGDALSEWRAKTQEHFGGPVKTLVRSATIAHGEEICRVFQEAGYDFRQVTAYTPDAEAEQMIEDFVKSKFLGLVSVDKCNKGFDVPDILCLIDQRPLRKSLASEIQFLGRGMRASTGKDFVLVLDHTGNYLGFMEEIFDFFADGVSRLDDGRRGSVTRKERGERSDVACDCGYVLQPSMRSCPSCGRERCRRRSDVRHRAGRMEEVTAPGSRRWKENKLWTWRHICRVALNGKRDMDAAERFAWKQYKVMMAGPPPDQWGFDPVEGEADRRVANKVQSQLIAWFNGKRRRGAS